MNAQLTSPSLHKAIAEGMPMERIEVLKTDRCTVYVGPNSYLLMEPKERDEKYLDDCKHNRYPTRLWLEAMREVRRP